MGTVMAEFENNSGCGCLHFGGGFGVGSIIAAILSWTTHHSILWCAIDTILGWFYVIFWVLRYKVGMF